MLNNSLKYKSVFIIVLTIIFSFVFVNDVSAQGKSSAKHNFAARYEIDAKRIGVSMEDKDALPRSREFIRLDSTYYVGWMYEGMYKFNRSADYLGYKYAIPPLQKAFDLLNKDFSYSFKSLFANFTNMELYGKRFGDLLEIAFALRQCYENIEMPDYSMAVLDKIDSYHFPKDFAGVYYERAWTVHRNRFYTSDKYSFLKNSVEENEKLAFKYCYDGYKNIQKNRATMDMWYGPYQSQEDILTIDHYIALLHSYNQQYDSSEFYYRKLEDGHRILWSNYAEMQNEIGNFDKALEYHRKPQYTREHALIESYYYVPTLLIARAETKDAISQTQKVIDRNGSTPGFGWYNIALARSYLYDGQLDSCAFYLEKASNFKELHIGTTLTQSQYDFTINLLKVQMLDKKMNELKFFNKGWWYSFKDLWKMISLKVEKMITEYVVVNELANNPERSRIIYDLFCAESTVSFDETLYLLKDFSLPYFKTKYAGYINTDKRRKIKRYFQLFNAKFKMEDGDNEASAKDCGMLTQDIITQRSDKKADYIVDSTNEKLFLARLYETYAKATADDDDKTLFNIYRNKYFAEYPQLLPFSGVHVPMKLKVEGESDAIITDIVKEIKLCNIEWIDQPASKVTEATITFVKKGSTYQAMINVKDAAGNLVVTDEQMLFKKADNIGKEIALRLFGIGGEKGVRN